MKIPRLTRSCYIGPKWIIAVWWVITIVTLGRRIIHIVLPDGGAMSIASIPLDHCSLAAQETIIAMFALWGLSQLLVGLVYVLVLVRQQSWIPFISLLLVLEYAIRIGLGFFKTVVTVNTAPGSFIDDVDGWSGATIRGNKIYSAMRDGLNRGAYSPAI